MKRENFIPFSKNDLVRLLAAGVPNPRERDQFLSFCRRAETIYHLQFHRTLEEAKEAYAALDPDRIMGDIPRPTGASAPVGAAVPAKATGTLSAQGPTADLLGRLRKILASANYREITRERIEEAFLSASPWGLQLKVDLDDYEALALYCRGEYPESTVKKTLIVKRKFDYTVFRHVVLAFKLKEGVRPEDKKASGEGRAKYRSDKVYLKLFKNVPTVDLEMLFPDTEVQIRLFDKMKVILPLAVGVASSLYKIVGYALGHGNQQPLWTQVGFWTLMGGLFGIALKGFFSYRNTVEKYLKSLTESLYFQNLDNNSGVFTCVLDDAEEEECKELFLGYYFLHFEADRNYGEPGLDARIEAWFHDELGTDLDFEVDDSIRKMEALGLLVPGSASLQVSPLPEALLALERKMAEMTLG